MSVERENVETVMQWLADGSPARSEHVGADALVEKLAVVVFGESGWPENTGRADAYREYLQAWFAGDAGRESQFARLTSPDSDAGAFIDWFLPVVLGWESQGAQNETQSAGEPALAAPEESRYSEPAHHDAYDLDYRYDQRDGVYEWYDEESGTWRDQAWADQHAADRATDQARASETQSAETSAPADVPEPVWDDGWSMFYRIGSTGEHEFADANTPGQSSSGCGGEWLSREQVIKRAARQGLDSLFATRPELEEGLSPQDIDNIVANLTNEAMGR